MLVLSSAEKKKIMSIKNLDTPKMLITIDSYRVYSAYE